MRFPLLLTICCSCCLGAYGQTSAENAQPKPTGSVSATTRLLNARTVYIKQLAGDDIVYEIVNNAIVGWPRYMVVDSPDKADLIIELSSPEAVNKKKDDDSKTSISGSSSGRDPRAPVAPTPTYTSNDVKLVVRDAHTRAVLWAGTELAKEAFRDSKTEQNIENATDKVLQRFHERIEPSQTPTAQQQKPTQ